MIEEVDDSVRVIASEPADRRLMNELLAETAPCPDFRRPEPPAAEDAAAAARPPLATLVCHRASPAEPYPRLAGLGASGRIVVFSDCTSEPVVVATLEAGAHHYFDITEPRLLLKARLAAALRSHASRLRSEVTVGPFRFDPRKRRVRYAGRPVVLSPKEFDLAFYLFSQRGRVVGNQELMTAVWSLPRTMDTRRIDTAACRVRKKMGLEEPGAHWYLRRLRGEGYVLVTDGRDVDTRPEDARVG